jgi:hypothetical protein
MRTRRLELEGRMDLDSEMDSSQCTSCSCRWTWNFCYTSTGCLDVRCWPCGTCVRSASNPRSCIATDSPLSWNANADHDETPNPPRMSKSRSLCCPCRRHKKCSAHLSRSQHLSLSCLLRSRPLGPHFAFVRKNDFSALSVSPAQRRVLHPLVDADYTGSASSSRGHLDWAERTSPVGDREFDSILHPLWRCLLPPTICKGV